MTKKWWLAVPAAMGIAVGLSATNVMDAGQDPAPAATQPATDAAAPIAAEAGVNQEVVPSVSLPVTRVVLFNSGVGYFSRSGQVTGDSRVDLSFQEDDINDLLKSMVLEDFDGGRIAAVSYDSREPVTRTLESFAINLNGNPTFAGILSQMRGERIEVVMTPTAVNQPGKLSGVIVGVETQKVANEKGAIDTEVLNMWCAEGLRSVKLQELQQLRFTNPVIENEFKRALETLSLSHDAEKKAVSLYFAGDGKRKVQVGYVVEAPIWKTSYRLVLGEKEKPYLQGWALVENTTDEDWEGVKMALISGRPISFKMDLYNPLFVPRPTVEPELFASLRPVTYRGGFGKENNGIALGRDFSMPADDALGMPNAPAAPTAGYAGGGAGGAENRRMRLAETAAREEQADRKAYAKQLGQEMNKKLATGSVGSAATAGALGDYFQYTIDHPVTLPRQKSAMLPIVGKDVEGQKVSIYNQNVQTKHPLLGLRFKNTTGAHLNQGPITVFEGSVYAGDTQVLDVQPNEERLVSYAIDLGTEVDPQVGPGTQKITSVKAVKGIVTTVTKVMEEKKYRIINRSQTDRTLVIEHPNRTNQQFKLVDTEKPVEDTPEAYRFQTPVKAGEEKTFIVKEERDVKTSVTLTNGAENQIRHFINLAEASDELKAKLKEALKVKAKWDSARQELQQVQADLNRLSQDQERIRKNLRETPPAAEVYKTYLKKLSDQEKEIDALTEQQKELMSSEFAARKAYDNYLANISD